MFKKREENFAAVILAGVGGELDAPQMIAVVAAPSAVHPGADDQGVEDPRIVFVDGVERGKGTLQIFGIEPSADCEDGAMDVLHVGRQVAGFPIVIVGVVVDLIVEQGALALQILREISDGPYVQIKLVTVFGAVVEGHGSLRRELRIFLRLERTIESEIRVQHERAAVVGVIAHEEIGHGSLRGSRFQSRMRVDDAGGSEEAGIRNSPDARVPIVVGHILEQPVDGVVEIAGVVDVLLGFLVVEVRAHFDELAFRHVTAADILKDENVSRLVELGSGSQRAAI